jgi:predicted acylesterase/phospholipase RssA
MLVGLGATTVAACDAPARLASLPQKLRRTASFHGMPEGTHIVLDGSDDALLGRVAADALRRELDYAAKTGASALETTNYLALSGGGENGAYGAGLLTGWTAFGTRPQFKGVTGISTGALIAPYAFLGPAYDRDLERLYTTIGQSDVMTSRGLLTALLRDSLFDTTPLHRLIRSALTPEMVAAIGREYGEKGRLLMVGTTNLDVPVGVLWNIGAIAASGHREAPELIAKILLASASIPGAFPPVMIDFESGGERFQEMHVDGGTVAQVVLYPPSFGGKDLLTGHTPEVERLRRTVDSRPFRLYIIRNARSRPDFETIHRSTLRIAGRAISTLISAQGIGDLYQLFVLAQRDGIDYNVTWIPDSFTERPNEPFDTGYMNRLFQVGRKAITSGTAWSRFPPGFNPVPLSVARPTAG